MNSHSQQDQKDTVPLQSTVSASPVPCDCVALEYARGAQFNGSLPLGPLSPPELLDTADFLASYGEPLAQTLNLDTWESGPDLASIFDRLDQEVRQALTQEDEMCQYLRRLVFPQIAARPNAPRGAGVFQAQV